MPQMKFSSDLTFTFFQSKSNIWFWFERNSTQGIPEVQRSSVPSPLYIVVMDRDNDQVKNNVNIEANITVIKTGQRKRSNKCNQCDYASSYAGTLNRHMKTHSGEKPNKCHQCNYDSFTANNLRERLKTHSGEKQNKCNHCEYASSRVSSLRRHLKSHNGEKPNKRILCDYASTKEGNLRKHWKMHSGEKSN